MISPCPTCDTALVRGPGRPPYDMDIAATIDALGDRVSDGRMRVIRGDVQLTDMLDLFASDLKYTIVSFLECRHCERTVRFGLCIRGAPIYEHVDGTVPAAHPWQKVPPRQEWVRPETLRADLFSGDAHRLGKAAWTVIRTDRAELLDPLVAQLPDIEAATAGVDLGGMLRSNTATLQHALRRLRFRRDEVCVCAAYPDLDLYDPHAEAAAGRVRVLRTHLLGDGPFVDHHDGECNSCGTRFEIIEGESHFRWWSWRRIDPPSQ
ncbi:hypothetical protein FB566_1707 [Stackebrandtia endophytica]|uniref:Uncharacterized protein n=1 Tax=Stackebrandtia endophytica TaxID=1496996 RepID=A0A543AUF6_9ACTN|nr:hypothetical protein [Stackebrandtia endophytica]TQL76185.1 hypothetical protein FB566_1707 [Stackebrandtia endophytica]